MPAMVNQKSMPNRRTSTRVRAARALALFALCILVIAFGCVSPDRPYGNGPDGGAGSGGMGGGGGPPVGQPCSDASACGTGQCVDGVCCDSPCTGTCQACTAALTGQTDGTCAPVLLGTDPKDQCADEGSTTCG